MRRSHLAPPLTSSRSSGVRISLSLYMVSNRFVVHKRFECTFVGCSQMQSPWGMERGGWGHIAARMLSQPEDRLEQPLSVLFRLQSWTSMPHICHEGECASVGSQFSTIRGLRQHINKRHGNTIEEESSLGKARVSKRKRDEEDEEENRRQRLRVQLALEAESRGPEPEPQQPVRLIEHFPEARNLAHIV